MNKQSTLRGGRALKVRWNRAPIGCEVESRFWHKLGSWIHACRARASPCQNMVKRSSRFFRYKYKHARQHTYRCFALWHIHSPELVHKPFAFYVASPNPLPCLVNLPFSGNLGSVTRALIRLRTVSERRKHRSAASQKLQHLPAQSASSRNMLRNAPDRWVAVEIESHSRVFRARNMTFIYIMQPYVGSEAGSL